MPCSLLPLFKYLTPPYRKSDFGLAAQYLVLFRNFPHLSVIPVTDDIAERAAFLRSRHRIRTPDALQLATALLSGSKVFLTNDENLTRVKDLRVLTLEQIT